GEGEKSRPYVKLARRQMAQIESSSEGKPDRLKIVDDAMKKAEAHYKAGNVLEAQKIWKSIVSLYRNNRELTPRGEKAPRYLDNKEVPGTEPEVPDAESSAAEQ